MCMCVSLGMHVYGCACVSIVVRAFVHLVFLLTCYVEFFYSSHKNASVSMDRAVVNSNIGRTWTENEDGQTLQNTRRGP